MVDNTPVTPAFGAFDAGDGNSNPNMPGRIYGVKMIVPGAAAGVVFSFNSIRSPVWGDFDSKDGRAGAGGAWNAVWNLGLANLDSENNIDFIARPDSMMIPPEVPEPGTMLLPGAGLAAVGLLCRKALA